MEESATLLTPDSSTDEITDALMAKMETATPEVQEPVEKEVTDVTETETKATESEDTPEPEATPETPDDEPKYKVKVRGEEREVKLDELLNGYSRTEDYKAKTTEVAEQRKALEAEKAKIVETQAQYLAAVQKNLSMSQNFDPILSEGNKTDWAALAQQDPTQYVQKRAMYEARVNEVNSLVQEQTRIQSERMNAMLQDQNSKLMEKLPEWATDEGKQKVNKTVSTFLQQEGFNNDEIKQLIDHRVLLLALKAAKYDELEKAKQTIGDKKVPSSVPKTTKPGAQTESVSDSKTVKALKQQALRSGKPEDAVNAIMAALNR